MVNSVEQLSFWETKYQTNGDRWDLGQPAPGLVHFVENTQTLQPGKVIVLGCGKGHDAVFLAQQGLTVTAVDFSPSAIAATSTLAQNTGVTLECLERNIFDLATTHQGQFDYLFEHTCFCAIAPERRTDYRDLAATLLKPGGSFYGVFFTHGRPGGPPFGSTTEEIKSLFSSDFEILELTAIANSIPGRQGDEHWGHFRRK